jgi:hypothetical protein
MSLLLRLHERGWWCCLFLTGGRAAAKRTRGWGARDTLLVSKLGNPVFHEFSRRIREKKGESEASLQEQMGHRPRLDCIQQMVLVLVLKFQSACAPVVK